MARSWSAGRASDGDHGQRHGRRWSRGPILWSTASSRPGRRTR